MRVLLRDDIAGVGKRGDIVEVAEGFARNYLLPTGRALVAGRQDREAGGRHAPRPRPAQRRRTATRPGRWPASSAPPPSPSSARAAAEGRLFGSVTAADVAEAIRPRRGPRSTGTGSACREPIKTVGTHVVPVQLHDEVEAEVTVEVVAERLSGPGP